MRSSRVLARIRSLPRRSRVPKRDRRQLWRAIEALGAGDVLLVTRLDRLARSTRNLLNVLATVSEKGASFRSMADA